MGNDAWRCWRAGKQVRNSSSITPPETGIMIENSETRSQLENKQGYAVVKSQLYELELQRQAEKDKLEGTRWYRFCSAN